MRVRWSPKAADDLEAIFSYIAVDNPSAATRVERQIYDRVGRLADFPGLGKVGRVSGARELPPAPLPFIAVYRVLEGPARLRLQP